MRLAVALFAGLALAKRDDPENHVVVLVSTVGEPGDGDDLRRCVVQSGHVERALPREGPARVACPLRAAIRYANTLDDARVAVTLRLEAGFFAVRGEPLPLITRDLDVVGEDAPLDEHRAELEATLARMRDESARRAAEDSRSGGGGGRA